MGRVKIREPLLVDCDTAAYSGNHPFGGSNKILEQYECIGKEFLKYELSRSIYGFNPSSLAFKEFREGVSFISLEVLESYLEDLLDLEVAETRLGIARKRASFNSIHVMIPILGFVLAICVGLYAASRGFAFYFSFVLTMLSAFPFLVIWQLTPRGVTRRLHFAQILSHEISRRRGDDDQGTGIKRKGFNLRKLFQAEPPRSAVGSFLEFPK